MVQMTDEELRLAISESIERLQVKKLNRNDLINRLTPEFKSKVCKKRLRNAITFYIEQNRGMV